MSQQTVPVVSEKTFSNYTQDQGKAYAQARRDYSPSVYQTILQHHKSTGGQLDTILDVGCGPGLAARGLAPYFNHAIGIDPSEGMITTARSLGGVSLTSEPIRFEISTGEELGRSLLPPIQDSSVDLITASNAAHWFDVPQFWSAAARVLKPGGSVALWTTGEIRVHPSIPNAAALQEALDQYFETHLKPYYEPGNFLVRNHYVDFPLPWALEHPVAEFDESTFFRKDWGIEEEFFAGDTEIDLDMFEKVLATGSPQTRWRQAHPDAIGTERDVVKVLRREIERLLHQAGVEKGKERIKGALQGAMLIVKKKQ